jgi:uncharacterized protein YutE (UPF0331/DUF86 family)
MIPSRISQRIVTNRLAIIDELLRQIRTLPLEDVDLFLADHRSAAAESYLRRALEAVLDIGRHILAKGFAIGVTEYKEIAIKLRDRHALTAEEANLLFKMAGYRNRMVHFYHEITPDELFNICATQLGDIERIADAYRRWVNEHPELVDSTL